MTGPVASWRLIALAATLAVAAGHAAVTAAPALAQGVPVSAATEEQKRSANKLYESGNAKSKKGDAKGAYADFRASYDIVNSPNTRFRIGRELAAQGRFAEAYREARATEIMAREASRTDRKYGDTERAAREEAAEFARKCGSVRVALVGRKGKLTVAGRNISEVEQSDVVLADPGDVDVTFEEAGKSVTKRVTVKAGRTSSVSFAQLEEREAPPPSAPKTMHPFDMGEGQRLTAYIVGGVGVVGFAMFAGFGGANLATYSDLEEQCPGGRCPEELRDKVDQGRSFQTAANVTVVIGAIGLAAGAGLLIPALLWGDTRSESAWVEVGPGRASLGVRFH